MRLALSLFVVLLVAVPLTGCTRSVVRETEVQSSSEGGSTKQTTRIDGRTTAELTTKWENEFLIADGTAPIVAKYSDASRNRGLAALGARTDAERNLARQVSDVRISETVIMRDLETSDYVRSEVKAVLKNVEVMNERCDDAAGMCYCTVRMPMTSLIRVVEAYNR